MHEIQLTSRNGNFYADSREVAEKIERPHNELLKSIRTYIGYLGEGKIPQSEYFIEATYRNEQNKELPCYLVTKKGCDMIANKLTGKKGVLFTAAYVSAFERMKQQIEEHRDIQLYPVKATSAGEVATLIKTLRTIMRDQKSAPAKIAEMAEGICHQFGVVIPRNFVEPALWEQMTLEGK